MRLCLSYFHIFKFFRSSVNSNDFISDLSSLELIIIILIQLLISSCSQFFLKYCQTKLLGFAVLMPNRTKLTTSHSDQRNQLTDFDLIRYKNEYQMAQSASKDATKCHLGIYIFWEINNCTSTNLRTRAYTSQTCNLVAKEMCLNFFR